MSNTRSFSDFDSPDSGTTLSTTEAGVLLTDTLEDFREKTNGIIEKVKATDTAATAIKAGGLDTNSVALTKIAQVSDNKLLGNVSGGTANVSEIEIDVTASGLQDSDDKIPTSKAVRDHVDKRYISGRINADGTAASLHGISISRTGVGVYNVIVSDSHQLSAGESYSVSVSINHDFDATAYSTGAPNDGAEGADDESQFVDNQYQSTVRKIDNIGGDPAYQVKIYELELWHWDSGSDDGGVNAGSQMPYRDIPFTIIGLPATDV